VFLNLLATVRRLTPALSLVNVGFAGEPWARSVAVATCVAPAVLDFAFGFIGQSPGSLGLGWFTRIINNSFSE
jgi:hypothetical protein